MVLVAAYPDKAPEDECVHYHVGSTYHSKIEHSTGHCQAATLPDYTFYPKDNTPGCTLEGQDFRDLKARFTRANTVVLGVSRDSVKSHEGFKKKQNFNFDLLADEDEKLCKLFDVIKLKNMYGKQVMGVERSTFLIDAKGVLRREWRKVKVDGHAAEVLEAAKAL
ncbi:MAG: peroxiredoxin [Gammaproteobacteria bacterium]